MTPTELEIKIRELRQYTSIIEEAQEAAEAIKDQIKALMGNTEELRAGEYKITWKAVKSSRIDTAALKKALPEIAAQYTTETTVRRFCVA